MQGTIKKNTYADSINLKEKNHFPFSKKMFASRLKPNNFSVQYIEKTLGLLDIAMLEFPENYSLIYEKAWLTTKLMPSIRKLENSKDLLTYGILNSTNDSLVKKMKRLLIFINEILQESKNNLSATNTVIPRINWAINNQCPMSCPGCYNTFFPDQLTFNEILQVIDTLSNQGVKYLTISGGDPLLLPNLDKVLFYANNKGLNIGLDTTAYTLNESMLLEIKDYIKYLGIPLDGSSESIIEQTRIANGNILNHTLKALNLLEKYNVKVKINTVVNKTNIKDIRNIGNIISKYNCVEHWSIFQWWPLRSNPQTLQKYQIRSDAFNDATLPLKTLYPHLKIRIKNLESRNRTHFFIENNGLVVTFAKDMHLIIGNILSDSIKKILSSPAICKISPKFQIIDRFL